jgi:hypothetical protein
LNAGAGARRDDAGLSRAQQLAARKQVLRLRSDELRASIARDCGAIARDAAPALALAAQAREVWQWLRHKGPMLAVGLGLLKLVRPARSRPARGPARLKRWWRKAKLAAFAGTVAWQALGRRGRR